MITKLAMTLTVTTKTSNGLDDDHEGAEGLNDDHRAPGDLDGTAGAGKPWTRH